MKKKKTIGGVGLFSVSNNLLSVRGPKQKGMMEHWAGFNYLTLS